MTMDYRQAFHEAYCAQQGLPPEADCTVPHGQLRLLYETDCVWVVLNEGGSDGTVVRDTSAPAAGSGAPDRRRGRRKVPSGPEREPLRSLPPTAPGSSSRAHRYLPPWQQR